MHTAVEADMLEFGWIWGGFGVERVVGYKVTSKPHLAVHKTVTTVAKYM